jgi:Ran GTPase-activating protein (RanGAP) involved in mRNA processing and transport
LGNKLVIELCGSIKQNKTLTKLNLSKNYITSTACSALSVMLLDNTNIKELYLYWNQIKGEGGNLIFQALLTNSELKVLDMAYNSLGIQTPCATSLAELLKANVELRHVDFSFNYFNFRDTTTISEGLNSNRSIYGFHFTGNKGYVDNKGFLIPIESAEEDEA